MSTYTKCGKLYEYKYKYGLREEATDKMIAGSIFHEAMHMAWLGHDVDREVIMRIAHDRRFSDPKIITRIENAVHVAYREVILDPEYKPKGPDAIGCEMQIDGEIAPGIKFLGFADLVTESGIVYDYKFTMDGVPRYSIQHATQLALYAHMIGAHSIGYLVFSARLDPKKTQLLKDKEKFGPIPVPQGLVDFAQKSMKEVATMIDLDLYWRTNPSNYWCNDKCPGHRFCFQGEQEPTGSVQGYRDWCEAVDDCG